MATENLAAVPYQSALIQMLRAATQPGYQNPGVRLLDNPRNSAPLPPRQPRSPSSPPAPAPRPGPPSPPPAVPPGGSGGGGGGGVGEPIEVRPWPSPGIDVVPDDDFVGPLPDDFVGPLPDDFVGPLPDDFVGPLPDDSNKNPTVTVNEVDVTEAPAPPTDAADDFEIDRELGIVQQSDVFVGPRVSAPITTTTTTTKTPSVAVNEVGLSDTVAPPTDPADDFEIDRELGLVQQSDVFMGPTQQQAPANTIANADTQYLGDLMPTAEQEMALGMLLEPSTWTMVEPDLSANLFAEIAEVPDRTPGSPNDTSPGVQELDNNRGVFDGLTDQDLMEMALFEMMTQELLTGRRPVVPKVTPRG